MCVEGRGGWISAQQVFKVDPNISQWLKPKMAQAIPQALS